jgi:hypothetical protein
MTDRVSAAASPLCLPTRIALPIALVFASASAAAQSPAPLQGPTWAIHGGASLSPGTRNTDFLMVSHNRPLPDLPHGLDLLRVNVGAIGQHRDEAELGRVEFVSLQLGSDRGRYTLAAGIAAVSRTTPALSSAGQFHTQLTVRVGGAELGLGHLSNAGLKKPNKGETFFTLGWLF